MDTLRTKLFSVVLISCLGTSSHASSKPHASSAPPLGRVTGVVSSITGNRVEPVSGRNIVFSSVGEPRRHYESVTDKSGTYTVDLPEGSYRESLFWFGDCSLIRRAAFKLKPGEHLKFDFLVVSCPITDTERPEVPVEEPGSENSPPLSEPENAMDVPLASQPGGYQEQLFPANSRLPEIIVSFGKCDNENDRTIYFSLDQRVRNLSNRPTIILKSLPVTITVDHYTVRGSTAVFTKRTMTFEVKGDVSVSDGIHTRQGTSATLTFAAGVPEVQLRH